MKTLTSQMLEKMLSYAELWMVNEQWNPDEIMVFKSDPVIRLLYGACAEELGNLQEEIFHFKQRLINETIEKLLPEAYHAPSPAHAIFYGLPLKKTGESKIGIDYQILLRKQENLKKEITFTPAGNFNLVPADVGYFIFRDNLYQLTQDQKTKVVISDSSYKLQSDVLWVGYKDLSRFLPRDKLSVFFNIPGAGNDAAGFYNSLRYCRCYMNDNLMVTRTGLSTDEAELYNKMLKQRRSVNVPAGQENSDNTFTTETDFRERLIRDPDYLIYKMIQDVRDFYQKQFITIFNLPRKTDDATPEEISKLFPDLAAQQPKEDVVWMKFSFGNLLDEKWINNLYGSVNCYPALNLKTEKTDYNLDNSQVNVFPVVSDDNILCLHSVRGKVQNRPEETDYRLIEPELNRTVTLEGDAVYRKGGLGRQDPRKLKNMINILSNLLEEETILFTNDRSREDRDKLNRLRKALTEFDQCIDSSREEKIKQSGNIILKPFKYHSKIFIRFWSTAADDANSIRPMKGEDAEKQCEVSFGPELKPDSIRLITPTVGGKRKPSEEEHMDSVRSMILTRGRIVTAEDVKAFCYEHFSGKTLIVDVRKTIKPGETPGFGLVKMIEVVLTMPDKAAYTADELSLLKDELLLKLEQHSGAHLPFCITIS